MRRAGCRTVAVSGLVAMCATGFSVLGAGSAGAAPTDIPLDGCNTAVQANPGDRLVVTAKTVLAPQLAGLGATPVVGPPLVAALSPALSSMTVGSLPVPKGATSISGSEIAKQIVAALPPVIPPVGVEAVRSAIANACQITITPPKAATPAPANLAPPVAAGQAPAAGPVPSVGTNPPGSNMAPGPGSAPSTPPVTSYGHVPRYSYGDLTSVSAGGAGFPVSVAPTLPAPSLSGYGLPSLPNRGVPGLTTPFTTPPQLPPFGTFGAPATQSPAVQPVSGMSEVTALPAAPDTRPQVPAEAVLAALMLSLTAAVLVRTWVLRRSVR